MVYEDYAELIIDSPKYGEFNLQIDLDDVEFCRQHIWHIRKAYGQSYDFFYAGTFINSKCVLLHRFIMNASKGDEVDHQDRNTLNNRKSNLRDCTKSTNAINSKLHNTNTSGYRGVAWSNKDNKWMAYMYKKNKFINLGYFNNAEEAYKKRTIAEKEYYGDFRIDI